MKAFTYSEQKITGNWSAGYALDMHIKSSEFLGYDEAGRARFDSVRTEVGEAVYQLKYAGDDKVISRLALTAAHFVRSWKVKIDAVVPVPASKPRAVQPVVAVAKDLASRLGVEFLEDAVTRSKALPQLKNVLDFAERKKLLAGAHAIDPAGIKNKNILLFDDLFQSGATMNSVTDILLSKGKAAKVYALTLTRTKR